MEGPFVKKPLTFLLLTCLLIATAGCLHKPVKAVILIPSSDNELPPVHVKAGGVLEFKMDEGTPANSKFEVQFSQQICDPGDKLEGTDTQPVICHVTTKGGNDNVDITISEIIADAKTGHGHRPPPKGLKLYIRPCKNCGH
jgi:hypothetical protein